MSKKARAKEIPDRIFYKLWKKAKESESFEDYLKEKPDLTRFGIEYDELLMILKEMYRITKIDFRTILDENNIKKAKISNRFCIPIRTVEDWYSGINKCPDYIRLMILRSYRLINLGKYIYVEWETDYEERKPEVYKKRATITKTDRNGDEFGSERRTSLTQILDDWETRSILAKTDYLNDIIKRRNGK